MPLHYRVAMRLSMRSSENQSSAAAPAPPLGSPWPANVGQSRNRPARRFPPRSPRAPRRAQGVIPRAEQSLDPHNEQLSCRPESETSAFRKPDSAPLDDLLPAVSSNVMLSPHRLQDKLASITPAFGPFDCLHVDKDPFLYIHYMCAVHTFCLGESQKRSQPA
jgi:hypothetical protein